MGGGRGGHPLLIDHISSGMFPTPRNRIREFTWRQFLLKLKIMYKIRKIEVQVSIFFSLKVKNLIPRNQVRQRSKTIAVEGMIFVFGFSKKYGISLLSIECRVLDWCRAFDRLADLSMPTSAIKGPPTAYKCWQGGPENFKDESNMSAKAL
jgi:hypothetical protein